MRRALPALVAVMLALPLSGCVVAAVPVLAGAAMVRSETKRSERKQAAAAGTAAPATASAATAQPARLRVVRVDALPLPPGVAPSLPAPNQADAFAAMLAHVQRRAALWREGAPINSLVLDEKQTVLNPVAIGCARRPPVVIVDLDPAAGPAPAAAAQPSADQGWVAAARALRAADIGIVWVTEQTERAQLPTMTGLDPDGRDRVMTPRPGAERKQLLRRAIAQSNCVLAVAGDKRGDADEAYDYLRSSNAQLPIDVHWGEGWFLLPSPLLPANSDLPQGPNQ